MKDKELLAQLNKLGTINLKAEVKEANRRLLMAQISQGDELKALHWGQRFNLVFSRLLQPYPVAAMIMLFFAVSGFFGWRAANSAQPGDSLYIAKRLSERTKMFMTFDDKSKAKLNVEFAGNRAKEISYLLRRPTAEADRVVLQNEFKSQLKQVKSRLAKLKKPELATQNSAEEEFLSASKDKDAQKIDIAVPKNNNQVTASSSNPGVADVLEEAEKLFDSQSYEQAADKLDEVNKLLDEEK